MNETHYGIELLHWAGMSDEYLGYLDDLVFNHPEFINFENKYGENALHIASRMDNIEIVKWLIKHTDINYQKVVDKGNALLIALENNNFKIADYLLKNTDIDYTVSTHEKKNIYHLLARNGYDDIIEEMLEKFPEGINSLDIYSQNCLFDFIEYFSFHKKYYLFDLFQENMNYQIFIKENDKNYNILQFTEVLVSQSKTKIEKILKEELYSPLLNILTHQF